MDWSDSLYSFLLPMVVVASLMGVMLGAFLVVLQRFRSLRKQFRIQQEFVDAFIRERDVLLAKIAELEQRLLRHESSG